jgi:hypothetical protein
LLLELMERRGINHRASRTELMDMYVPVIDHRHCL